MEGVDTTPDEPGALVREERGQHGLDDVAGAEQPGHRALARVAPHPEGPAGEGVGRHELAQAVRRPHQLRDADGSQPHEDGDVGEAAEDGDVRQPVDQGEVGQPAAHEVASVSPR